MIFDRCEQLQARVQALQRVCERSVFLRVLCNREGTERYCDFPRASDETSHQIGSQRTAGKGVHRDDGDFVQIWSIGHYAHDGYVRARRLLHPGIETMRTAGEENDPIGASVESVLKRFFFAFSELRVGSILDPHVLNG